MNFKYKGIDKESIIKRHLINGESVAVIVADTGIPRSTVYNWIKTYKEKSSKSQISLEYDKYHHSNSYRRYLEKLCVTQSFSKSGAPHDNAVI